MESVNVTFWASDTEGRIDAWLMVWEHLKHVAEIAKVDGNHPVRISVTSLRPKPTTRRVK